jgi:hypothetical protein
MKNKRPVRVAAIALLLGVAAAVTGFVVAPHASSAQAYLHCQICD